MDRHQATVWWQVGDHMYVIGGLLGCVVLVGALLAFDSWRAIRLAAASLRHFPGPKPRWPKGTAHLLHEKHDETSQHPFEAYGRLAKQYGKFFSFFLARQPVVVVSDADAIKEVMLTRFRNFRDRWVPPMILNCAQRESAKSALTVARGGLWMSVRGAVQPIFHSSSLQNYSEFMNQVAEAMVKEISDGHLDGRPFDISHQLHTAGIAIIFKCAFGISLTEQDAEARAMILHAGEQYFQFFQITSPIQRAIALLPHWLWPLGEHLAYLCGGSPAQKAHNILYAVLQQLAENYCAANKDVEPWTQDRGLLGSCHGRKLLREGTLPSEDSILVACLRGKNRDTNQRLSPRQVLSQGLIFTVAGYETTATTLSVILHLICKHPEVEKRLLEEIEANGRSSDPTFNKLDAWKYTKAVLFETLRLHPILPVISRVAIDSCSVAGKKVPAGTTVHMAVKAVHMDEELWPEANKFRPERFLEDPTAASSSKFLGFGFGPRNCIGQRFAIMEAVTLLVRLYQKFSFCLSHMQHPEGNLKFRPSMVVQVDSGVWVHAYQR